jgi:hypothetical protein
MPSPRLFGRLSITIPLCLLLVGGCWKSSTPPAQTFAVKLQSPNELRDRIDAVVDYTLNNRTLNTRDHNAWQIVHGILPYGHDFKIERITDTGSEMIPALDWLLQGGALNGWSLRPGEKGIIAVVDPGSRSAQGHPDQWIGYLSQCGVKPDDKIIVQGREYTIGDIARQAEWDIYPGMEACWTLMSFSTFFGSNHQWVNKDGDQWNMERLEAMEADAPVVGEKASCGGTHRLYGLTVGVNRYMEDTGTPLEKLTGGWLKGENVVQDCVRKAREYQQPDGSFSTGFFARPGSSPDVDTTLHSTGHTLEWLDVALTKQQLQEPWVTAAVTRLCQLLEDNSQRQLDCGALYHAARGLKLYRDRLYGPRGSDSAIVARAPADTHSGDSINTVTAKSEKPLDESAPVPPPAIDKTN